MTTVEESIRSPHFRLKVDLSKFFYDARRFCCIFIDGTKIQQINHLKQHISKLFNIAEPFHLLLNNIEFLPPTEDVRILKENETILVVPGSGINNETLAIAVETSNDSMYDTQTQTRNIKIGKQETVAQNTFNDTLNNTQPTPINNITKDMTFYSVISDTVIDHNGRGTDSKTTDNLTEDCNMIDSIISITKRKRIRKRKSRNRSRFIVSSDRIEENLTKDPKSKKPKIIDTYIIPSGKHIRFDNMENDEHNIAKQIVQEVSRNESYLSKTSSSRDLSALLALGQSSTPITFRNKKLKNEVKMENVLNDQIRSKNLNKIMEDSTEKNLCSKESENKIQNYKNLYADLEKIPIMTRKPQVNDIITFKILKIGTDYTPQVSNSILTEVVACIQSEHYILRILHDKKEIQEISFGKFSVLNESESHPDGDTFILNYSQMIEPRLIS